ncbi:MAG: nucleotidyltransferase family protein [Desulfovibrio sp.]
MKQWRDSLIQSGESLQQALQILNTSSLQIALVVNAEHQLLGTVTDGDIRRGLLANIALNSPVDDVMNTAFTAGNVQDSNAQLLAQMRMKDLKQIPILDTDGCIIDLVILQDMLVPEAKDNWVVLMAGGLGTRLRPLTENCPKPLLKVGGKPVLETIMEGFISHGFYKFFLSVNYRADMIEEYFGDGSKFGVEIRYLKEKERLGTAGALSLLPEAPTKPLFVMNGDLLTRVNFSRFLDFHTENGSSATMGIREYDMRVPYGVVEVDGHRIMDLKEKPLHKFFVNAGIYTLSPEAVAMIPSDEMFDMPSLFRILNEQEKSTMAFPIHEYWMDIGQRQDFDRANSEFHCHFPDDCNE